MTRPADLPRPIRCKRVGALGAVPILRTALLWLACVGALCGAPPLHAQRLVGESTDSVVPRELFDAMFRLTTRFGRTRVFGAALPPAFGARFYLPPSSRVVGGIQNREFTLAIIDVPVSADSAIAVYGRELARRGWTHTTPRQSGLSWGFRPAPDSPTARLSLALCQNGQALTLAVRSAPGSDTAKMIVTMTRGACGPVAESRVHFTANPFAGAPILVSPAGTGGRMGASCERQGGSAASSGPNTALRTSMTPNEILQYYGRQLADSGWTQIASVDDIARTTWQRMDSTGARLEVTLTASTHAGTPRCRDVEMEYRGRHP